MLVYLDAGAESNALVSNGVSDAPCINDDQQGIWEGILQGKSLMHPFT